MGSDVAILLDYLGMVYVLQIIPLFLNPLSTSSQFCTSPFGIDRRWSRREFEDEDMVVPEVGLVIVYEKDVTDSWYAWEFFFPVVLEVWTDSWYAWGVFSRVALKVDLVIVYEKDATDSWYAWGFFFPVVLKVGTDSWHAWGFLLPVVLKVHMVIDYERAVEPPRRFCTSLSGSTVGGVV